MSSVPSDRIPGLDEAPYVGALLRLAHQEARSRLLDVLAERGFEDINEAYFGLFQYPPIDGMRPAALAKRLGISKQALNHLLGQLEKMGYVQRHRAGDTGVTTVRLTDRGWGVVESNVAAIRQLESDWARQLGMSRFAELKATLRELTGFS